MIPCAQYIIRFKNNLIGKHFRCLQELAIFQLHDLVRPEILTLWRTTGELGALLFYPEIRDIDEYLVDLQIIIDNLLDAWVQDIRRFGPAILYATEIFESYNHVFRLSSIYLNHQAPSLDIATGIAGTERLKHVISGGWWLNDAQEWVQAGTGIREIFDTDRNVQRRLGWNSGDKPLPGIITKPPTAKQASQTFSGRDLSIETNLSIGYTQELVKKKWLVCENVIAQPKDVCSERSWVFFNNSNYICCKRMLTDENAVGCIMRILISPMSEESWIVIHVFGDGIILITPSALVFLFNAQHDCYTAKCSLSLTSGQFVTQERIKTSTQKTIVRHASMERYLINMHALHNAHLLREALPRSLTQPIPIHQNREEAHKKQSIGLSVSGQAKRDATKVKAAQTRQLKKNLQNLWKEQTVDNTDTIP
ncbi:hypothetical protein Agabi119p4_4961 [Agaricus bisporus var. burnettii]|uniref:Uncharacterized protein n=1 Tax=Agaricus bisporus var. burnettii TaxID=192524 RepID=A0A8H7KHV8_AGABI|nr:hypothetical protein Agabi119p4_4961 [Agaricus bisporus var. burnettii]